MLTINSHLVQNKKRKHPNDQNDDDFSSAPLSSKHHALSNSTPNPASIPKFLQFQLSNFALPPPAPLSSIARQGLALKALRRIWEVGSHLSSGVGRGEEDEDVEVQSSAPARELWMMLGSRLVTRGSAEELEEGRKAIVQFIAEDFGPK